MQSGLSRSINASVGSPTCRSDDVSAKALAEEEASTITNPIADKFGKVGTRSLPIAVIAPLLNHPIKSRTTTTFCAEPFQRSKLTDPPLADLPRLLRFGAP